MGRYAPVMQVAAVPRPGEIWRMARSTSPTVAGYLEELPPDRRKEIQRVRAVIRKHLPAGFEETMNWGMISYEIPLSAYSTTYNKKT